MNQGTPFAAFLQSARAAGGLKTDDVLAAFLPLARRVAEWHAVGLVAASLEPNALHFDARGALQTRDETGVPPRANTREIEALQRPVPSALHLVGHPQAVESTRAFEPRTMIGEPRTLGRAVYVLGYRAWEQRCDHHDPLSDIFVLGLLLATLALDIDCNDTDDLERFIGARDNLFLIAPRLHPVLAAALREMTELDRHARAADLTALIRRLETYREQPPDLSVATLPGFASASVDNRRALIQEHLRDRLFEISRRNRLLYFKPSQANVNLTVASVPLVLNLHSVRSEQLFVWQGELARQLSVGKAFGLGKWLRFEDQPYLSGALDQVIADARRARAEYGFAQLRLVVAFLQWHNLKDAVQERVHSPLLLLPVELVRRKGVRDQYVLEPTSTEAEINPALRHHLRQLYNLQLPESLDLSAVTLTQFHQELERQIRGSEPAVTLRYSDQPDIELLAERARQRLAHFERRRTAAEARAADQRGLEYPDDPGPPWEPEASPATDLPVLRDEVEPEHIAAEPPAGEQVSLAPEANEAVSAEQRETFVRPPSRASNPYLWDFDLCALTLGNFNYRKMSLVRDYSVLIEGQAQSEPFDRVFSVEPRPLETKPAPRLDPAEEWTVVRADATQRSAVALARTGRSYIVQGPPGTGKSQTITNLIADCVARGQRVLFVCEKRAAIDVVFHRLRQQGLDELCCLIHDSQADKKAFIQNLQQTYETWLAGNDGAEAALQHRERVLERWRRDAEQVERFDAAMAAAPEHVGQAVRELLRELVRLRAHEPQLTALQAEQLPSFDLWRQHGPVAQRLARTFDEVTGTNVFSQHPFRYLSPQAIAAERPLQQLLENVTILETALESIEQALSESGLASEHWQRIADVESLVEFAGRVLALAQRGQLALLDPASGVTRDLHAAVDAIARAEAAVSTARQKTVHWRDKLPAADTQLALERAVQSEQSWWRWLKPAWRRLETSLEQRYDFSQHAVRPPLAELLRDLQAEHAAVAALEHEEKLGLERFTLPPQELLEELRLRWSERTDSGGIDALCQLAATVTTEQGLKIIAGLCDLAAPLRVLAGRTPQLLESPDELDLAALAEVLRDLREAADALPDLLPVLSELMATPGEFRRPFAQWPLALEAFAAAIARESLERLYRQERWLHRFDGRMLESCVARLSAAEQDLLSANARAIRAVRRQQFRRHVELAGSVVGQLDVDQKAFKRSYAAGRRELEHEFGKTMRHKSIRDLATGESGLVVNDLKPIWLMSPLSVSDTLPLEGQLFDVVIFDEASQIPVEQAVPALYRAPQVIVVGDEMQLPPTSFFTTSHGDTEAFVVEEEGERVAVALDADSLLTQSARNLPATLLAWHYRSRSESLIGFSNAAFYAGNLFTIPDRELPMSAPGPLLVDGPQCAAKHLDALLSRPVSFHLMNRSPYAERRNAGEATYIAAMVREILRSGTRMSLGIVAFSEAQQRAIESALDVLASNDPELALELEAAYAREEDDQFCGLFIKNLENVQGDERDIMLLSICYGPDVNGRMLMNFGPINQRGGEKRLNVIVSRARQHMAVVSSIRHDAITNEYNDGAAALQRFLRYAEHCSSGDLTAARSALDSFHAEGRKTARHSATTDIVAQELRQALEARGYEVAEHVGQSRFRCDLAVRVAGQREHRVGLLLDSGEIEEQDAVERHVSRPTLLRAFGWRVITVLTRDWYHEPEGVLDRIERCIHSVADPTAVERSSDEPLSEDDAFASSPQVTRLMSAQEQCSLPFHPHSRSFEMVAGTHARFWEVSREDRVVTTRFGRLGSRGQLVTKSFPTQERAEREMTKLVEEKLRKGYREVTASPAGRAGDVPS